MSIIWIWILVPSVSEITSKVLSLPLSCLEKFTEQYFINEIEIFIKQNNILNDDIHGGRKRHSTKTAITNILNTLHYNYKKYAISPVLVSDLSACYDTVDSQICPQKIDHYGIGGDK